MFDMHCHILPGVDDGSRNMAETIAMLDQAKASGIDHIICSPHCRSPWFDYLVMRDRYQKVRPYAEERGIWFEMGFEVNWKKLSEIGVEWSPRLRMGSSNWFLLEFSDDSLPAQWKPLVRRLQSMNLRVIIAHPERYRPVQRNLDIARQFKEMGCQIQLSGNCLRGGRFDARYKTATALLKEGLVDYIASDAHCPQDYEDYRKVMQYAQKHKWVSKPWM